MKAEQTNRISRRRLLALGAASVVVPTPVFKNAQLLSSAAQKITLQQFGARGDGRTDDTAAVLKALNSGSIVDGENRSYAVAGNLHCGARFVGVRNARLIQTAPGSNPMIRTVVIENANDFVIENVEIDRGGDGSEIKDRYFTNRTGGLFIVNCRAFQLHGVSVRGGGIGSGFAFIQSSGFTVDDVKAYDTKYRLPQHPTDDAIHGLLFIRCSQFTVTRGQAYDLGGSDGVTDSLRYTRGFGISACRDFRLIGPEVKRVGQGVDISGSDGNRDFRIMGGLAEDCDSWGFKFANSASYGSIENAIARRPGLGGFVVSGQSEQGNSRQSHTIAMARCRTEEVLGSHPGGSFGFGILSVPRIDRSYPRAVVFRDCVAITAERDHRMEYGFRNDVPAAMTEGSPNRAIDCRADGWRRAAFTGFA